MRRTFDVIVVGCGAMGSAACRALARRGVRTLGLERFRRGHDRGSSHGHSRVIRQAYFEHPDYVPLVRRSYELFRELQSELGVPLLAEIGGLFIGCPDSEVVAGSLAAARLHDVPHELLAPREVARRHPALRLPEDHVALYEPGAGFVRPEATVLGQVALAERDGARILEETVVRSWTGAGDAILVETSQGEFRAERLVLCGGPWSARLLPDAMVRRAPLRVTRQAIVWIDQADADQRRRHSAESLPIWLADLAHRSGEVQAIYGVPDHPMVRGSVGGIAPAPAGMKIALHGDGESIGPDDAPTPASDAEIRSAVDATRAFLPDAAARVSGSALCRYTYSPDGHFLIDRLPQEERVVVACGFSGHGFKFAPAIGELLADLVEGLPRPDAAFLSAARFPVGG